MRLAALTIPLFVIALLGEGAVRLVVPRALWDFQDAASDWQPDPRLGWVQKPHLDVSSRSERGWVVRFRTNSDGLTPPEARRPRRPGFTRILVVGDSTAVGRSVPQDLTVSAALERQLHAAGYAVEVLNAGVEAYATDQALLRMEQLLPLYRPDVVLYSFCENDFGGNASATAYGLNKPHFTVAADGSAVEHSFTPNTRLRPQHGEGPSLWIQYSAVFRLLRPRLDVVRAKLGGWENRNLLGLPADYYYHPTEIDRMDWRLFGALLTRMKRSSEAEGAHFLFYAHPALEQVWDPTIERAVKDLGIAAAEYDRHVVERRLARAAQETGTDFCPMVDAFIARQAEGPFHLLPRDAHCNPTGYRIQAELLAKHLTTGAAGVLGPAEDGGLQSRH